MRSIEAKDMVEIPPGFRGLLYLEDVDYIASQSLRNKVDISVKETKKFISYGLSKMQQNDKKKHNFR
jgi:hypothetical protein